MGERNATVARTPPLAPDRKAALTTKKTETYTDELLDRINVDARAASYVRSTFGCGDAHNVRRAVLQTATWIKELPNAQFVFAVREGRVRSDRHRVRPDRRRHLCGDHHRREAGRYQPHHHLQQRGQRGEVTARVALADTMAPVASRSHFI